MLFHSQEFPGHVMNRYGVVLCGARICDKQERSAVIAEAMQTGWKLSDHAEVDVGRVWLPPDHRESSSHSYSHSHSNPS